MEKINLKTNDTNMQIEIYGQPNYDNMSEVDKSVFAGKFEKVVFEIFEKYLKRKK